MVETTTACAAGVRNRPAKQSQSATQEPSADTSGQTAASTRSKQTTTLADAASRCHSPTAPLCTSPLSERPSAPALECSRVFDCVSSSMCSSQFFRFFSSGMAPGQTDLSARPVGDEPVAAQHPTSTCRCVVGAAKAADGARTDCDDPSRSAFASAVGHAGTACNEPEKQASESSSVSR